MPPASWLATPTGQGEEARIAGTKAPGDVRPARSRGVPLGKQYEAERGKAYARGVPVETIVEHLREVRSPRARYHLLLALRDYPIAEIPPLVREQAVALATCAARKQDSVVTGGFARRFLCWLACAVLIGTAYRLGRRVLGVLGVLGAVARSDGTLMAEVPALRRHENAVLRRQIARVRYEPADRAWFAALSALIPRTRWAEVFPVTPATLLSWHREYPGSAAQGSD